MPLCYMCKNVQNSMHSTKNDPYFREVDSLYIN